MLHMVHWHSRGFSFSHEHVGNKSDVLRAMLRKHWDLKFALWWYEEQQLDDSDFEAEVDDSNIDVEVGIESA